jgi:hypothetical protein
MFNLCASVIPIEISPKILLVCYACMKYTIYSFDSSIIHSSLNVYTKEHESDTAELYAYIEWRDFLRACAGLASRANTVCEFLALT